MSHPFDGRLAPVARAVVVTIPVRRWAATLGALGVLALLPGAALAAPGDPDTQFGGGDGYTTTNVSSGAHDAGNGAASDALGRVYVAGRSFLDAEQIAVARYDATGLDTSFANGGKLTIPDPQGGDSTGNDVLAYRQGSIDRVLIAGSRSTGLRHPMVVALRSDGTPDTRWSDDGFLSHSVPGASEAELTGIARQNDGKIVVSGWAEADGARRAFVARYTAAGERDTTFSSDGMHIQPVQRTIDGQTELASFVHIEDVAIDNARDRIVLAGGAVYPDQGDGALAIAFRSDGTLDTGWHAGGVHHVALGAGRDWFNAAVVQSGGRVVLVGAREIPQSGTPNGYVRNAITARLGADGHLDLSYGGGNGVTRWHGVPDRHMAATDVAIAAGRLVVAVADTGGIRGSLQDDDTFTTLRYTANGSADLDWGPAGLAEVRTNINPSNPGDDGGFEYAGALAIRPNDSVAVVGTAWPGDFFEFAVAYYRSS
jgi:uncharacterized delta-60 repeat protein